MEGEIPWIFSINPKIQRKHHKFTLLFDANRLKVRMIFIFGLELSELAF